MIVAEHNIRSIIDTIPSIRINDELTTKPNFHWGDDKELARYLEIEADNAYPLIWLLPSQDEYEYFGKEVNKKCDFIIATREANVNLLNDQRFINSFDTVLNPLCDRLIHGLKVSTISDIEQDWKISKFPNYSKADKNGTIDLWDALKLTINVKFTNTNNCLLKIDYGKL